MQRFWIWFKKYFAIFLTLALVIASVVMTVDFTRLLPVDEVIGEGKGTNHTVTTREEFDAILDQTALPLTARFVGTESTDGVPSPTFQSVTLCVTRKMTEDEGWDNLEYVLALTADAAYLKWTEAEFETFHDGSEDWGFQIEFYVKGGETFARVIEFHCIDINEGVETNEEDLKASGADDFEGIPLEMACGKLFGKWVRVTGMRIERMGKSEIGYACTLAREIGRNGVFTAGEEPSVVLEEMMIFTSGAVMPTEDTLLADYKITHFLQYKYINNTVIEDVSEKKTYELNDET